MKKTIRGIIFLGIISTFITTPAHAEPSYLICKLTFIDDKGVSTYSVKVDEANGTITHSIDGTSYNTEGSFSANTISYQDPIYANRNNDNSLIYTIDRTTLKFTANIGIISLSRTYPLGEGSCEVEKIKDRKI